MTPSAVSWAVNGRSQGVEGTGAARLVESLEHPAEQSEHEAHPVVGAGPEPHAGVRRVELDVGEPRRRQDRPHPIGLGERQRSGGVGRRCRAVATGGERSRELTDPLVVLRRLPGEQHETADRAQGPGDVGERGDEIAEEHRPGPADGHVERSRPRTGGSGRRPARSDTFVTPLRGGAAPGVVEHPGRQVDTRAPSRLTRPGRRPGWSDPSRSRGRARDAIGRWRRAVEQPMVVRRPSARSKYSALAAQYPPSSPSQARSCSAFDGSTGMTSVGGHRRLLLLFSLWDNNIVPKGESCQARSSDDHDVVRHPRSAGRQAVDDP